MLNLNVLPATATVPVIHLCCNLVSSLLQRQLAHKFLFHFLEQGFFDLKNLRLHTKETGYKSHMSTVSTSLAGKPKARH